MFGLHWDKPIYKRAERFPNIPSSESINMIIAHSSRKYATVFSVLRDTGLRPIELERLTSKNIDYDRDLIYPESAKGGRARMLKLQSSTLAMLKELKGPFPKTDIASHVWMRIRN
jgi:integrase